MDELYLLALAGAVGALLLTLILAFRAFPVPKALESTDTLLRRGALTCLWRQALPALLLLGGGAGAVWSRGGWALALPFLAGGLCVLAVGICAAWISTRTASRTAAAATGGLAGVAASLLRAGGMVGFLAAALALGAPTVWYLLKGDSPALTEGCRAMALGAAATALPLSLFGGIFAESAALAAPILPRDDPRNPCAPTRTVGRGVARVQAPVTGALVVFLCVLSSALTLGERAFPDRGLTRHALLLPLVCAGTGLLTCLVGAGLLKPREVTGAQSLLTALRRASLCAGAMTALLTAPLSYLVFGLWQPYWAILAGVVAGVLLPLAPTLALPVLLYLLLGVGALTGLSAGILTVGGMLAGALVLAGGVWSASRRVVEGDRRIEKGSEPHRSIVTADILGRPLRGCVGPALTALFLLAAAFAALLPTLSL